MKRPNWFQVSAEGGKAIGALHHYAITGTSLPADLIHLIFLRVSQINGCAHCIDMGLPRSWWEGSERHIQLSVVEHHPQFKALPVSVSPGFYPQQPDLAVKCLRISV